MVVLSSIRSFVFCRTKYAVNNLTIIGSGLMGSGIAQVSAQSNISVTLVDQEQHILDKAKRSIKTNVERVAKKKFEHDLQQQSKFVENVQSHLKFSINVEDAVSNADLVIEAIVENIQAKQKLLAQVENGIPMSSLIATNTSSLKLSDIGSSLKNKQNFGGLHFFNPVPVMKLLEVIRSDFTTDQTFDALIKFGQSIGKVTVACKDTPGFIVNRLLVPYMFEALRMYERGDASKEDIDQAMKHGASYPMGPFQLADYVGLDTLQFIQKGWNVKYPNEALFSASKILDKLVSEGKFGMKSGEGFYKYTK